MFKPKKYQYSTPFSGDAGEALKIAKTTLLSLGFEITAKSENELHAIGPGLRSTQQPDLLGVTELKLKIDPSSIIANAVLGGAARMKAFVIIFPPGLVLFLLLIFSLIGMDVSLIHALWFLPWLFISPLMGNMIERKTIRAVESLVRGMAQDV